MAYQKLQVSRAVAVIPSDTVNIPDPATQALTGIADFSVAGTLTDVGTTFTSAGIQQNAIVYNTTASIAYYVTEIVSDTALSLSPSSAGGAVDAYVIYNPVSLGCVLYIGAAGNVKVTTAGGDEVTFVGVNAGTFLPVQVIRVWDTGTAATNILALW
mgnify:CR=1 FL=1|tara:strand:- start:28 stop:498 length:471 start_codon:yes stop_codon:yes gene_type:complete